MLTLSCTKCHEVYTSIHDFHHCYRCVERTTNNNPLTCNDCIELDCEWCEISVCIRS